MGKSTPRSRSEIWWIAAKPTRADTVIELLHLTIRPSYVIVYLDQAVSVTDQ